jgi:membrane protein DedA with SNARE-associated domain
MHELFALLEALPPLLIYVALGVGAALENIVPPVPADTFIVLGGFLAARGSVDVGIVFLVTWAANVGSALAVYGAGHRYGRPFFADGVGRKLLQPAQLERMEGFYNRWGVWAIFFTRFMPGLRAIVPVFAGVSHQRFLPVAAPIVVASGLWHGLIVWLGFQAGRNLDLILRRLEGANLVLLGIALLVFAALGLWWYRSREKS